MHPLLPLLLSVPPPIHTPFLSSWSTAPFFPFSNRPHRTINPTRHNKMQ